MSYSAPRQLDFLVKACATAVCMNLVAGGYISVFFTKKNSFYDILGLVVKSIISRYRVQVSHLKLGDVLFSFSDIREKFKMSFIFVYNYVLYI